MWLLHMPAKVMYVSLMAEAISAAILWIAGSLSESFVRLRLVYSITVLVHILYIGLFNGE